MKKSSLSERKEERKERNARERVIDAINAWVESVMHKGRNATSYNCRAINGAIIVIYV